MSCNFCKNISFLALGLRIYCKFCPMDTRSQEPEPKLEYSHKPVKTFHARARAMATKNPRISAIDTMKKVPEVFPEYKYKDVFYGGSSSRNSDENPWQKETNYDSRSISSTYNGKWILNAIWSIPTQSPRNPHAIPTQFPRNPHAIPTQFPRNPHAIPTQFPRNPHAIHTTIYKRSGQDGGQIQNGGSKWPWWEAGQKHTIRHPGVALEAW